MMLALILLASVPADEPQWNCDDPGPQQEMNWCANQDYREADEALNAQWTITAAAMKQQDDGWDASFDDRAGFFETLREAQRAWIRFRDAHCASEGYVFRGGSMEPFMVATCKTTMTQARTKQLRELVEMEE